MATRRSRIQVKPNTGRVGGAGPAKPAPAKASPRKSTVSKPPNVEVEQSENTANATAVAPPQATETANSVTPSVDQPVICSPVRQEVPPVVPEKEIVNEKPAEDVDTAATENVSDAATKDSEPVKKKRRVSKPQPNVRGASGRGVKRREPEPVVEVEDSVVQAERRTEPPVVVVEETSPAESPMLPPSRTSGKAVIEKRARKENKELQARKRRQYRTGSKSNPPDRSSMTMLDLIYYNPPGNPMPEKPSKTTVVEEVTTTEAPPEEEEENGEEESVGPRVRVGPDGEITIDEESLVIRRGPTKEDSRAVVYETGTETHYGSFRKKTSGKRTWTTRETARFYRALSVCGTDFTLMSTFFPKRTRQDLKNKFKREERINRELVDKTINDPTQFDTVGLEDEEEEEERVDDPDDPRGLQNGHDSPAPRKRRKGRQPKTPDKNPDESVIDVEMEVVEEDTAADNVVPLDEEERAPTPPPVPQACATPLAASSPAPGVLSQGQLVFYASHSQEQVVHVFVVSPQANVSASELVSRLNTPPLSQQKGAQQGTPQRTPGRSPLVGFASPPAQASTNGAYSGVPSHSLIHRTPGVSFLPKGITPLNASPLQPGQQGTFMCQKGTTPVSETSMQPLLSQEGACECQSTLQEDPLPVSAPLGVDTPLTPESVSVCEAPQKEKMGPLLTPLETGSHESPSAEQLKGQRTAVSVSEQSQKVPTPLSEKSAETTTCQDSSDARSSEPITTSVRVKFSPVSAHVQLQKGTPLSTPPRENTMLVSDGEATLKPMSPPLPVSKKCAPRSAGQATAPCTSEELNSGPSPKDTPEPVQTQLRAGLPLTDNDQTLVKENTCADSASLTAVQPPQAVPKQTSAPMKPQGAPMRRRRAVVCPKTTSEPRVRQKAGAT
ncbi:cell surface glycoprotein 1-like [Ornithodoros turicata]|uniref:cell surface glycoprotein 1-like n=1 Tax=Ornithodoros turicata TaxID=34597 RepID=UPI003139CE55